MGRQGLLSLRLARTDAVHPLHHDIRHMGDNWQETGSTGGLIQVEPTTFPPNFSMTHWASPAPGLLPAASHSLRSRHQQRHGHRLQPNPKPREVAQAAHIA